MITKCLPQKNSHDMLLAPVLGVNIYNGKVGQVCRYFGSGWGTSTEIKERGRISYLSKRSLARMIWTIQTTEITFKSLLTLTYPAGTINNGQQVKDDLDQLLTRFRHRYPGLSYFWFLEFTKRGTPHIHIFVDIGSVRKIDRVFLGSAWSRIIADTKLIRKKVARVHAHEKCWEDMRLEDAAKRYAAKYAAKPNQKWVPERFRDVGRFWATSKNVKNNKEPVFVAMSEKQLRAELKRQDHPASDYVEMPAFLWGFETPT